MPASGTIWPREILYYKKGGEWLRRPRESCVGFRLSAEADADRCKRTVEAHVGGAARFKPAIPRTEEEIGTISRTQLGIREAIRKGCETADVRNDDHARARAVHRRVRVDRLYGRPLNIADSGVMTCLCLLTPEQNSGIHSP